MNTSNTSATPCLEDPASQAGFALTALNKTKPLLTTDLLTPSPAVAGRVPAPLPEWGSDSSVLDLLVTVPLKMGRFFQCPVALWCLPVYSVTGAPFLNSLSVLVTQGYNLTVPIMSQLCWSFLPLVYVLACPAALTGMGTRNRLLCPSQTHQLNLSWLSGHPHALTS